MISSTRGGDLDWLIVRAETLFVHDPRGRLLHANEPDRHPPPRVWVGRSTTDQIVRFGPEVPEPVARHVGEILGNHPADGRLAFPDSALREVRRVLEGHHPIGQEGGGPAYRFPDAQEIAAPSPPVASGQIVLVTTDNVDLIRDTFAWLRADLAAWWPCFVAAIDGVAVSACFSSRIGVRANEAGVRTLNAYRRRGYAAAVTAAWAEAIRQSGRQPIYSTSRDNLASQGVAKRLGLVNFSTDAWWS